MFRKLAFQILAPVILLLAGIMALFAWLGFEQRRQAHREVLVRFDRLAQACAGVTIPRTRLILEVMRGMSGAELILCGLDGTPASDEAGILLSTIAIEGPLPALDSAASIAWPGRRWVGCRIPWGRENQFTVVALVDRDSIEKAARNGILGTIGIGCAIGVPCVAFALWLASRLTRRIASVIRQTERIAQGDFAPIDIPEGTMELEELGRAINAMATRLRVHEAELRVSERSSLVGQLGAGVAHQVRNSATGARLAVQLHAKALGNPMPEDLAVAIRQLDLIEIQARQLLELGRPSARSKTLVNPAALADDVASMVGPRCRHSGITLEWRHPLESSPPILADAESLRMALLNLVTNAVEAAGPRGEVRVSLAGHADGSIEFTIQDNGPGPAPHLVDRLFEPFATGKREGIGLGLAVARRVAREHGGDVSWRRDSAITTFTLTTGKAKNP